MVTHTTPLKRPSKKGTPHLNDSDHTYQCKVLGLLRCKGGRTTAFVDFVELFRTASAFVFQGKMFSGKC